MKELEIIDIARKALNKKVVIKQLQEETDELDKIIIDYMIANDKKELEVDDKKLTLVDEKVVIRFDSTRFRKEHPRQTKEYLVEGIQRAYYRTTQKIK